MKHQQLLSDKHNLASQGATGSCWNPLSIQRWESLFERRPSTAVCDDGPRRLPQPGLHCLEFPTVLKRSVCFCVPGRGSTGSCRCLQRSWRTSSILWMLSTAATSRWRPSPLGSVRGHKTRAGIPQQMTNDRYGNWNLHRQTRLLWTAVHMLVCY